MTIIRCLLIMNAVLHAASFGFAAESTKVGTEQRVDRDALLESQKEILFTEDDSLNVTFRVREDHPRREAIDFLEQNGSAEAVDILGAFLTNPGSERKLKQLALAALGRIGTTKAVDAIVQFETWSRDRFLNPPAFHFGKTEHAIDHYQNYYVDPAATTADSQGTIWALVPRGPHMQLTSSVDGEAWTRPIMLDLAGMPRLVRISDRQYNKECELTKENDILIVTCDGKTYETTLAASQKDSDSDGLADIVEADLQTDPTESDTDKDGVADGRDSNPLTPRHSDTSDIAQIRQAVFAMLFATCSNTDAIVIVDRGEFAKQEYYDFAGSVLRSAKSRDGFVNITDITVTVDSSITASARISDWEGSEAGSTHEAKLKKIDDKWVVVEFQLTRIS